MLPCLPADLMNRERPSTSSAIEPAPLPLVATNRGQPIIPMGVKNHQSSSHAIAPYSPQFYLACSVGGLLSCGSTHTLITPIDLVKCRKQINPNIYSSLFNGLATILRSPGGGLGALWEGWLPTAIGYSMQGACKFGFYEYFKKTYSELAGSEHAYKHRTALYLAASASAELIADVALCPLEALKVRMQTSTTPFATSSMEGFRKIYGAEGLNGFFKGLGPLWLRQVPYTMMKFAAFERTVEAIYSRILAKPKSEYNKLQQLGVTFVAGYWAGIFCAVISHPADTIVSKLNNSHKVGSDSSGRVISNLVKELGFKGIWRGLSTRIFMIGTLTALQWFIYDSFKVNIGLATSGTPIPTDQKTK